ncbi:copper homeostasis protein [Dactylonectria macrodidyma]|uniref:Copper homeostasis protein cutC homolog n=1 Tax=Dactylonectria macrodidyma TaxID=307937 RepID=A0A9P9FMP3_9HYPO|nr:copper homeostasis protein [Dactylonectria macrodidyma]
MAEEIKIPLEVAVFSPGSALYAQELGVHRVELNARGSYDVGGLTPDVADVKNLYFPPPGQKKLDIPIRIMIRPRPAPGPTAPEPVDFIYSDAEFNAMKRAIKQFKKLGVLNPIRGDAFVFGILERCLGYDSGDEELPKPGSTILDRRLGVDKRRCRILVELAKPVRCVFHRAFDLLAEEDDWKMSINELARCDFTGVLTSGGNGPFYENIDMIGPICQHMSGLQLIVGGGLRRQNVNMLIDKVRKVQPGLNLWAHSSCLARGKVEGDSNSEDVDGQEVRQLSTMLGLDFPE